MPYVARTSAKMAWILSIVVGTMNSSILMLARNRWGGLFSSDERVIKIVASVVSRRRTWEAGAVYPVAMMLRCNLSQQTDHATLLLTADAPRRSFPARRWRDYRRHGHPQRDWLRGEWMVG